MHAHGGQVLAGAESMPGERHGERAPRRAHRAEQGTDVPNASETPRLFTVEGVHLNLWKERIWAVIENAGLLQDIAWKTDLEDEEIVDTWGNDTEEYEVDLDNLEYQAYES